MGKGDYNHNDRGYIICTTNTGQLITQNRKHVKPTQITAEQNLWNQLDKHIVTDPLENILKQTPINYTYTQKEQFKNTQNRTHKSDKKTRKHDDKSQR